MDFRLVTIAVPLIIGGIGVWMKVSDGSLTNRWWSRLGTTLILSGFLLLGLFFLTALGASLRSPIVFGDEQLQSSEPYRPIPVNNKTFRNQEVLLDGYSYDHCTFENVTFVYNGTTPPNNVFPTVRGDIHLKTNSVAVEGTAALFVGLGLLDPKIRLKFTNPNAIIRAPDEPVE